MSKEQLSVGNSIKALALINIQDIFSFTITAKDEEIRERYGSEESAVCVAEKYLDIALKAGMLEHALVGWNMNYTMPIKDSDERADYTAYFYNKYKEAEEAPTEPEPAKEAPNRPGSNVPEQPTVPPMPKGFKAVDVKRGATIKRPVTGMPLTQDKIDQIKQMARDGKTVKEICDCTGVSDPTVRKYKKEVMDCEE